MANKDTIEPPSFTGPKLLEDGAPFSESTVQAVTAAFSQSFREGAIVLRATSREGDALNFRFYERRPVAVLRIAEDSGLLESSNQLARLLDEWSKPWAGDGSELEVPKQSCDFDPVKGLVKAWAYMGAPRPLYNLFGRSDVPQSITKHRDAFYQLGLISVRHVAVDFYSNTVNIYFGIQGPMTAPRAAELTALADYQFDLAIESADQFGWLPEVHFPFAVTIEVATGKIKRVAWYALGLSMDRRPELGGRLETFLKVAPDYDVDTFLGVAWSFGPGQERYLKVEKSYGGGVVPLMKGWKSPGVV
ncbi:MAG: hypothetical protein Q9172_003615 [Xanthocarpia lactea]